MSALDDIRATHDVRAAANSQAGSQPFRLGEAITLERGRLHEVEGPMRESMAKALLSKTEKWAFWITHKRGGKWRGRSLEALMPPEYFTCVQTGNRAETLWAAEQALRCPGIDIVILDMWCGPDLFESRRLQVAAQIGGGLGLVLIERHAQSSAAQTRWHASRSSRQDYDWNWALTKDRRSPPRIWSVKDDPPSSRSHPPDLRPPKTSPPHDRYAFETAAIPTLSATSTGSMGPP